MDIQLKIFLLLAIVCQFSILLFWSWQWRDVNHFPCPNDNWFNETTGDFMFPRDYLNEILHDPYFSSCNNVTGFSKLIVPNIVHFLRLQQPNVTFVDLVTLLAAYYNQKPDRILIHCDDCKLQGPYWIRAQKLIPVLELHPVLPPQHVFGRKFSNVWHKGDVARIKILQQYGGIMLDNDVYIVQSLDTFRKFEMSIGWDDGVNVGMQVLIANPKARYLQLWYQTYRDYQGDKWYYNAGQLPTKIILGEHPELVHRVKKLFGVGLDYSFELFEKNSDSWHQFYTCHLLLRHVPKPINITMFNEVNIKDLNITFGRMARLVYYGTEELLPVKSSNQTDLETGFQSSDIWEDS